MIEEAHIKPFLKSINNMFTTMLSGTIEAKVAKDKSGLPAEEDFSVVISLTGTERKTTMAVTFPPPTASALVEALLGMPVEEEELIIDGISEVANIIGGGAKSQFQEGTIPIELGLPQILVGNRDKMFRYPSSTDFADVSFNSSFGAFYMRISSENKG